MAEWWRRQPRVIDNIDITDDEETLLCWPSSPVPTRKIHTDDTNIIDISNEETQQITLTSSKTPLPTTRSKSTFFTEATGFSSVDANIIDISNEETQQITLNSAKSLSPPTHSKESNSPTLKPRKPLSTVFTGATIFSSADTNLIDISNEETLQLMLTSRSPSPTLIPEPTSLTFKPTSTFSINEFLVQNKKDAESDIIDITSEENQPTVLVSKSPSLSTEPAALTLKPREKMLSEEILVHQKKDGDKINITQEEAERIVFETFTEEEISLLLEAPLAYSTKQTPPALKSVPVPSIGENLKLSPLLSLQPSVRVVDCYEYPWYYRKYEKQIKKRKINERGIKILARLIIEEYSGIRSQKINKSRVIKDSVTKKDDTVQEDNTVKVIISNSKQTSNARSFNLFNDEEIYRKDNYMTEKIKKLSVKQREDMNEPKNKYYNIEIEKQKELNKAIDFKKTKSLKRLKIKRKIVHDRKNNTPNMKTINRKEKEKTKPKYQCNFKQTQKESDELGTFSEMSMKIITNLLNEYGTMIEPVDNVNQTKAQSQTKKLLNQSQIDLESTSVSSNSFNTATETVHPAENKTVISKPSSHKFRKDRDEAARNTCNKKVILYKQMPKCKRDQKEMLDKDLESKKENKRFKIQENMKTEASKINSLALPKSKSITKNNNTNTNIKPINVAFSGNLNTKTVHFAESLTAISNQDRKKNSNDQSKPNDCCNKKDTSNKPMPKCKRDQKEMLDKDIESKKEIMRYNIQQNLETKELKFSSLILPKSISITEHNRNINFKPKHVAFSENLHSKTKTDHFEESLTAILNKKREKLRLNQNEISENTYDMKVTPRKPMPKCKKELKELLDKAFQSKQEKQCSKSLSNNPKAERFEINLLQLPSFTSITKANYSESDPKSSTVIGSYNNGLKNVSHYSENPKKNLMIGTLQDIDLKKSAKEEIMKKFITSKQSAKPVSLDNKTYAPEKQSTIEASNLRDLNLDKNSDKITNSQNYNNQITTNQRYNSSDKNQNQNVDTSIKCNVTSPASLIRYNNGKKQRISKNTTIDANITENLSKNINKKSSSMPHTPHNTLNCPAPDPSDENTKNYFKPPSSVSNRPKKAKLQQMASRKGSSTKTTPVQDAISTGNIDDIIALSNYIIEVPQLNQTSVQAPLQPKLSKPRKPRKPRKRKQDEFTLNTNITVETCPSIIPKNLFKMAHTPNNIIDNCPQSVMGSFQTINPAFSNYMPTACGSMPQYYTQDFQTNSCNHGRYQHQLDLQLPLVNIERSPQKTPLNNDNVYNGANFVQNNNYIMQNAERSPRKAHINASMPPGICDVLPENIYGSNVPLSNCPLQRLSISSSCTSSSKSASSKPTVIHNSERTDLKRPFAFVTQYTHKVAQIRKRSKPKLCSEDISNNG